MILTCPECATSYFVDEARIPPRGRMVRCSSCGARWRATPDGDVALADELAEADHDIVVEGPEAEAEGEESDLEFVTAPIAPTRGKADKPRRTRLLVGGGAAAAVVLGLGAAIMMREQIATMAPGTAGLFRAVGLKVSGLGLVIENVKSTPNFEAGRPVLTVTGAVRNVRHEAVEVPSIRISLLDRGGKPVMTKVVDPIDPKVVPGGARRYFAVSLPDPPSGARDLEVGFAPGAKSEDTLAHAAAAEAHAAAEEHAADAPSEAQSLTPGSPDALDHHE